MTIATEPVTPLFKPAPFLDALNLLLGNAPQQKHPKKYPKKIQGQIFVRQKRLQVLENKNDEIKITYFPPTNSGEEA